MQKAVIYLTRWAKDLVADSCEFIKVEKTEVIEKVHNEKILVHGDPKVEAAAERASAWIYL